MIIIILSHLSYNYIILIIVNHLSRFIFGQTINRMAHEMKAYPQ